MRTSEIISALDTVPNANRNQGATCALEYDCDGNIHRQSVTDRCSFTTNAKGAHAAGFPPNKAIGKAVTQRVSPNN